MNDRKSSPSGELRELRVRLRLAQILISLWHKGYDALLHYGINMKSLKSYTEHEPRDPMNHPEAYAEWAARVGRDLDAAKRRKGFKVYDKEEP